MHLYKVKLKNQSLLLSFIDAIFKNGFDFNYQCCTSNEVTYIFIPM